jgi:hypothetical protein
MYAAFTQSCYALTCVEPANLVVFVVFVVLDDRLYSEATFAEISLKTHPIRSKARPGY